MLPKIKEATTITTRPSSIPTTPPHHHHRSPTSSSSSHKVSNFQSTVASILILICLNLYLNIADFDHSRHESRSVRHVLLQTAAISSSSNSGDDDDPVLIRNGDGRNQAIIITPVAAAAPPPSIITSRPEDEATLPSVLLPAPATTRGSGQAARNNGKPTLVLHMGPTKTGSTFTQCVLTSMEKTLALDNYTYVGMGINPCQPEDSEQQLLQHCYNSMFAFHGLARIAPEGLSILREARNTGRNAIFVNECFEFYTPDQIKVLAAELRPSWNVQIILNYRRVFEFLPSSFNQNLKPKKNVPQFELWPGESARIGPVIDDNGTRQLIEGRNIAPFDIDNRNAFSNQFLAMERQGLHPIEEVRRLYRHYWPDITIIKLHELNRTTGSSGGGDAGLQKLFCDILNLPHSCAAAKLDSTIAVAASYSNTYQRLDYELLANEAFHQELFGFQQNENGLKLKRRRAVHKIKDHQEHDLNLTISDFPQDCLAPHKMDRILNASIFVEKTLFPKEITPETEANHRKAFDEYNQKKKRYCTIDVHETLKNAEWRAFLATL